MTKEHLQKLANEGNFEQLFTLLDQYFAQNPRYEYSQLKQNILHELSQGRYQHTNL